MYKLKQEKIEELVKRATKSLYNYCKENSLHFLVTGSSGGLDSAITLGLAERACKLAEAENYKLVSVGLIMPCHSKDDAERLGRAAIEKFHAHEIKIDLSDVYDFIENKYLSPIETSVLAIRREAGLAPDDQTLAWDEKIVHGNIKARSRMMLGTYNVARLLGSGLVLSTDNQSECWMAFWTHHGDVGDFGMIQELLKGLELFDVARFLEVPAEIVAAKPDDGLAIAGGDEDQLGATYPNLDTIMISLIQKGFDVDGSREQLKPLPVIEGFDQKVVENLARRCLNGAHKRRGCLNLSRKELGVEDFKEIVL
ncbi:MAG: NH(3)-dependent NAD(+) synthetase [Parcubacteria group bacterium GW2011_GWC2_39_14]|nr:MAG: NH(3)-dependent NAD(+) synthetase [Parcubacteria group bacterium GW2011_GWC2_39_14]KKR55002.1 MAG: NH(3)-dependent NAD(+) synthetase [Parcubacteria group bacterium GW2011_GWA2_40_23]